MLAGPKGPAFVSSLKHRGIMHCDHYCNNSLRCLTCTRRFYAWAEARTNSPPPRKLRGQPGFYSHVNVISPPLVCNPAAS